MRSVSIIHLLMQNVSVNNIPLFIFISPPNKCYHYVKKEINYTSRTNAESTDSEKIISTIVHSFCLIVIPISPDSTNIFSLGRKLCTFQKKINNNNWVPYWMKVFSGSRWAREKLVVVCLISNLTAFFSRPMPTVASAYTDVFTVCNIRSLSDWWNVFPENISAVIMGVPHFCRSSDEWIILLCRLFLFS